VLERARHAVDPVDAGDLPRLRSITGRNAVEIPQALPVREGRLPPARGAEQRRRRAGALVGGRALRDLQRLRAFARHARVRDEDEGTAVAHFFLASQGSSPVYPSI